MLKEHAAIFRRFMIFVDLLLGVAAFFIAYWVRQKIGRHAIDPIEQYMHLLPLLLAIWITLLYQFRMYASFRLKTISEIMQIIGSTMFIGFLLFGSVMFIFKMEGISRLWIALVFFLMGGFLAVEKVILITFFRRLRAKGFNFRNILVVGTGKRAQKFMNEVRQHREFGFRIVGIIDEPSLVGREICGCKVLGTIEDIPDLLKIHAVDHVFFIVPRSLLAGIEGSILHCETVGVAVSLAVDLFDLQFTFGKESSLFGLPIITFESTPDKVFHLMLKRLIDVILTTIGLFAIFPLYALIALAIKLTSKGPVYFVQKRCGLNGRHFNLYKFRTMEEGAEAKLQALLAHNEMRGPAFKMKDDPRVTRIGKILRKTSLDEIPQLWNVLKGEMSLVGPRPPIPKEVEQYHYWHRRRLSMRPGITCLWQISGRNNIIDFDKWMKLDLEYIDNWSLTLDFNILLKTVPAVVSGAGAK